MKHLLCRTWTRIRSSTGFHSSWKNKTTQRNESSSVSGYFRFWKKMFFCFTFFFFQDCKLVWIPFENWASQCLSKMCCVTNVCAKVRSVRSGAPSLIDRKARKKCRLAPNTRRRRANTTAKQRFRRIPRRIPLQIRRRRSVATRTPNRNRQNHRNHRNHRQNKRKSLSSTAARRSTVMTMTRWVLEKTRSRRVLIVRVRATVTPVMSMTIMSRVRMIRMKIHGLNLEKLIE